jgi:hypothetical protein
MSLRYPGGLIIKNPTAPTTSAAPGIWTLEQATQYIKAGTWPLPPTYPSSIEILLVAGGGGGSTTNDSRLPGGCGGAGGYISNGSFAVSSGNFTGTYTVTVGGGGAGGYYGGSKGTDSVFSGTNVTTQTAYGGGGGGGASGGPSPNQSGGSGGGGGANVTYYNGGPGVYPGSTYISAPRQGYDGGGGGGFFGAGGGGGGAGSAGSGATGGTGVANSISGSSVTYATGATWPGYANGADNTGNGAPNDGVFAAYTGGSGIVVLRYPDSFSAASATTGSPTITVSGGYRVYKFTSSGSITF